MLRQEPKKGISIGRKPVVVAIAVFVALLHFVTGPGYGGPFRSFVNGYLIDILLPFAMYLILGLPEPAIFRSGPLRGVLVFAVGAATETLQYFGVPVFGRTFDPLDYLMFAVGIAGAALLERTLPARRPRLDSLRVFW